MTDGGNPRPPAWAETLAAVRALAEQAQNGTAADAKPIESINDGLRRRDYAQDIELKRQYARWFLRALTAQIVVANLVFIAYAQLGVNWAIPPAVMQFWLAATVVEIVGVVLVVTRYLFPNRDQR
jgi:hypothetical protein